MIALILGSKLKAAQSMFLGGPLLNAKLLERLLLESLGHDFLSVFHSIEQWQFHESWIQSPSIEPREPFDPT